MSNMRQINKSGSYNYKDSLGAFILSKMIPHTNLFRDSSSRRIRRGYTAIKRRIAVNIQAALLSLFINSMFQCSRISRS